MSIESPLWTKIHGILVGIDDAVAAVLFNGQDDITISTRCGMALIDEEMGWKSSQGLEDATLIALADGLNDLEKNHCFGAIVGDISRAREALATLQPYEAHAIEKCGTFPDEGQA